MTIIDAFKILIEDKSICREIGIRPSNYRQLLKRFRDNDPMLTTQTMLMWLEKAGWTYKVECFPPILTA